MATINTHRATDGTLSYRVRIRRKGQQTQTASFSTLKEARSWATMIEGNILAGRHFPHKKPQHTLSELLDRYVEDIMPRKTPETQKSHMAALHEKPFSPGHYVTSITYRESLMALPGQGQRIDLR